MIKDLTEATYSKKVVWGENNKAQTGTKWDYWQLVPKIEPTYYVYGDVLYFGTGQKREKIAEGVEVSRLVLAIQESMKWQ